MLKYSRQRELIERTVKGSGSHLSASEIYDALHPVNPALSLGTVYRNLTLLSNKKVIRKLHMPDGSDRFDGSTHEHAHVVCDICGKVEDVTVSFGPELADMVLTETGFVMAGSQILITGSCESCREEI